MVFGVWGLGVGVWGLEVGVCGFRIGDWGSGEEIGVYNAFVNRSSRVALGFEGWSIGIGVYIRRVTALVDISGFRGCLRGF